MKKWMLRDRSTHSAFDWFYDGNIKVTARSHKSGGRGISMTKNELEGCLQQLNDIQDLEENWNGNGASAFSTEHIAKAWSLIHHFPRPPLILPTARDSIQMEYEKENGDYLEFELFENGRLKMFSFSHTGKIITKDVSVMLAGAVVRRFYGSDI